MSHRLDPLLNPRSIAVVGASERPGSVGSGMIEGLQACAFAGPIHAVNPKYDSIHGLPCVASLKDLPEAVDLAIIGVNSAHIEGQLADAIARGIKAAVIFDTCYIDDDPDDTWGCASVDPGREKLVESGCHHALRPTPPSTTSLTPRS